MSLLDYLFQISLRPSQVTLLLSTAGYHLVCGSLKRHLRDSHPPTLTQLHQSRELLSILHGTLVTVASVLTLRHYSAAIYPPKTGTTAFQYYPAESDLPLISTRSELLNCLTGLETGYLAVDSVALFRLFRHGSARSRQSKQKQSDTTDSSHYQGTDSGRDGIKGSASPTILAIHHAILLVAFTILHLLYIPFDRERGVVVIVMLLLLNASNPFGSLRWWVVNFGSRTSSSGSGSSSSTSTINQSSSSPDVKEGGTTTRKTTVSTVQLLTYLYLFVYATVRILGIGWLLHIWGLQLSLQTSSAAAAVTLSTVASAAAVPAPIPAPAPPSIWTVLWKLRPWCRTGTILIWTSNSAWFALGLWKAVSREMGWARRQPKRWVKTG